MEYSSESPASSDIECPIISNVPRISGGIRQMCTDLSHICDSWGIYNDYTKEPESDPLIRQFLSISLLFDESGEDRFDTTVYKDYETKNIVFRCVEHFQRARKATQYVVNKAITEFPVKAIYRRINWEELDLLK